jgi:hypothetical protein
VFSVVCTTAVDIQQCGKYVSAATAELQQQKKYKRLKLGDGQAYESSSD